MEDRWSWARAQWSGEVFFGLLFPMFFYLLFTHVQAGPGCGFALHFLQFGLFLQFIFPSSSVALFVAAIHVCHSQKYDGSPYTRF